MERPDRILSYHGKAILGKNSLIMLLIILCIRRMPLPSLVANVTRHQRDRKGSRRRRSCRVRARDGWPPCFSFLPPTLISIHCILPAGLSDPSCCRTTFPVRAQRNQRTCTFSLSINDWILVSDLDYIGLGTCRRSGRSLPPQR